MAKRYFSSKKSKYPALGNIVAILVVLVLVAYGVSEASSWFKATFLYGKTQENAPALLDSARQLLAANDVAGARETVAGIIARVSDPAILPEALGLLADIERSAGDTQAALAALERASIEFPGSPTYPEIATKRAAFLEELGRYEDALNLYEEVRRVAPPEMASGAVLGLARNAEREGGTDAALTLYEEVIDSAPLGSSAWNEAVECIGRMNVARLFAPEETEDCKYYVIQAGDSLTAIGNELNTTQGLLIRANGIDNPALIRPGQRLKYTPKDFRILIELSTCRLYLLDKDGIFKRYSVGLGMPGHETATGRYSIGNKEKDPTWHKPGSEPIPPGDPRNELGTRWMPLVPAEGGLPTDLGIHGTINPDTVGNYVSRGCPRLRKEDVEELYDLVVRSTPVEIVDKIEPANLR